MLCKHDSQLFIMTRSLIADCEQTVAQQKQVCECVSLISLLMVLLLKLHHYHQHHHHALMLHNVPLMGTLWTSHSTTCSSTSKVVLSPLPSPPTASCREEEGEVAEGPLAPPPSAREGLTAALWCYYCKEPLMENTCPAPTGHFHKHLRCSRRFQAVSLHPGICTEKLGGSEGKSEANSRKWDVEISQTDRGCCSSGRGPPQSLKSRQKTSLSLGSQHGM